jgi:hypothetical protein
MSATDRVKALPWRLFGAGAATLTLVGAFVYTALLITGLWAAVGFGIALVIGASTLPLLLLLLKDDVPAGNLLGKWMAILAQFTFGGGAVVRTEDGSYEWQRLRETDAGRYAVKLNDGTVLTVKGDPGDLYRFGGQELAIIEEKGENVERFTVAEEPPETAAEATRETRAGMDIHHPDRRSDGSYLISLKQLAEPAAGSAGPHIARRGREKALEEAGGEQGFSGLWLTLLTGGMAILGFGMGYGALML